MKRRRGSEPARASLSLHVSALPERRIIPEEIGLFRKQEQKVEINYISKAWETLLYERKEWIPF